MPTSPERAPLAEDHAAGGTALLIIDMLSTWEFPQAEELLASAEAMAPRLRALKHRCRQAGVPVIYANDNQGRWRSDFRQMVEQAKARGGPGAQIAEWLAPDADDYFVLKPKHSAFYATPMDLLLRHLHARRLLLTGVSSDHCVLMTAADAHMRDYEVWCPADCMATQSEAREQRVLAHLEGVMGVRTDRSDTLSLPELDGSGK
ncbi:MAG: cysteine hydrolase [Rubrivivax sp.]|nr:MAG: cysteine hydrolase [Rubrivivax sp.]